MEMTAMCKRVSDAIERLQKAEASLNTLLQETKEITEQVALLDRLPKTLNMQQVNFPYISCSDDECGHVSRSRSSVSVHMAEKQADAKYFEKKNC